MPDIKYVCLSDMHLGEEDSLLTNLKTASRDTDPLSPSPVLEQLVACLSFLIRQNESWAKGEKPELILAGDILELALTTMNEAAMAFERFIELVMKPGDELFSKIIYIPGNHDHHLWESARETQYVEFIRTIDAGKLLDIPWHTTHMYFNGKKLVRAYVLTNLIRRIENLQNFEILTAYPNYCLYNRDEEKCVVFTHGHFIEPLYTLMSFLRGFIVEDKYVPPTNIKRIEAENFAWIDFFWSTMGRSGDMGKDIELIYEKIHYPEQLKKLLHTLAKNITSKYNLVPLLGEKYESILLEKCFDLIADRVQHMERSQTDEVLSSEADKGLRAYMTGPLRGQMENELPAGMPRDVTMVFGHTHKPFERDMNFKSYPQWVNVYNTGGWVIESTTPQPLHGGAVVLIDDELNAVSLRMYNEEENPLDYQVQVKQATHPFEPVSQFLTQISGLINRPKAPFSEFSQSLARAINVRRENLKDRINEMS